MFLISSVSKLDPGNDSWILFFKLLKKLADLPIEVETFLLASCLCKPPPIPPYNLLFETSPKPSIKGLAFSVSNSLLAFIYWSLPANASTNCPILLAANSGVVFKTFLVLVTSLFISVSPDLIKSLTSDLFNLLNWSLTFIDWVPSGPIPDFISTPCFLKSLATSFKVFL